MDVDEETSSSPAASVEPIWVPERRGWCKAVNQFTQQSLPSCKPVLTPIWIITTFLVIGAIFVPCGFVFLNVSQSVVEIIDRYDIECIPDTYRGTKLEYITDNSISKNCTRHLKVPKYMKAPIYVYYQLDNYYQNHRRYVKSRSDKQLLQGSSYHDTSSCQPEEFENGLPVIPCGLIAWSLFNDTYSFFSGTHEIELNRKNITWMSDRDHKFGKEVFPFNFQNGSLIGGAKLDPSVPLSDQEDLIVWMRTSALPTFRKLYGKIEIDLEANSVIKVNLVNNYNTYSFGGRKKIVLTTNSWLGGQNHFLGMAYMSVGSFFLFLSILFTLFHIKNPRPYGDTSFLCWNWKGITG